MSSGWILLQCELKSSNKPRRQVCFKGAVVIGTKTRCRHGCRLPGLLCSSRQVPQSCACPGPFQLGISSPWLENRGQGLTVPWWCSVTVGKGDVISKENVKPGNAKNLINNKKFLTPNQPRDLLRNEFLTMPTVVSQQGPLGTSAGSRGGGVAVLLFSVDELWWPSSVQCVTFFTTSSSASCNEETPPPHPSQNHQEIEVPEDMSGETQGIGSLGSPLLPTSTCHRSICLQQSCSAGNSTETPSLLPGAGEQQPFQTESRSGHCEFGGASSLLPTHGGARPPSRLLCAERASTQSSFLTFFTIFQGRANRPNSSRLKTESFFLWIS